MNDQNFDLAEIDHRLRTYLAIFYTMWDFCISPWCSDLQLLWMLLFV